MNVDIKEINSEFITETEIFDRTITLGGAERIYCVNLQYFINGNIKKYGLNISLVGDKNVHILDFLLKTLGGIIGQIQKI